MIWKVKRQLAITLLALVTSFSANASSARKSQRASSEHQLDQIIRNYRTLKITPAQVYVLSRNWSLKHYRNAPLSAKLKFLSLNARLTLKSGYPVLSFLYASEALKLSPKPQDRANTYLWRIIDRVSSQYPVQYLMEEMSMDKELKSLNVPSRFVSLDWHYVLGSAFRERNELQNAIEHFSKVKMSSKKFMSSQYQLAMIYYERGDLTKAFRHLDAMKNPSVIRASRLPPDEKKQLSNFSNLALGRLHYQTRDFYKSVSHFRRVSKDSPLFYEALFEQSWALFMAGSLKHALGSLYGVHSPYFKDRFNPESKILESMIYFWMCRYDDSRNALADFTEYHADAVTSLDRFLSRSNITPEMTYNLFENLIAGVTPESIGIPESVLKTASDRSSMMLMRDQYATLVEELDRLQAKGIFGVKNQSMHEQNKLRELTVFIQKRIGAQFLAELRALHGLYENLYDQAQFLYVELLMSEKEQLLGRELHANSKVRKTVSKEGLKGWSYKTQSWEDDKEEFWWDEIGFHVIDVEPVCK